MSLFENGGTLISAVNGHSWLLAVDMWLYEILKEQFSRNRNILRITLIFRRDLIFMWKLFSIVPLLISPYPFSKIFYNQDWVTSSKFPILKGTFSDHSTRFKFDLLKRPGMLILIPQMSPILILLFEKDLIYLFLVLNLPGVRMLLSDTGNQGCLTPYLIIITTFMEMKKNN